MTSNIIKKRSDRNLPEVPSFSGLVDQLFNNNLNRIFNYDLGLNEPNALTNIPVNVHETDKSYELELIAPGLRKEDFKLNVHRDILTVSFERREETNNEKNNWIRQEYKLQSFTRSFTLDDTIDAAKISAKYNDGVLHLSLPKNENTQKLSRNIEIK